MNLWIMGGMPALILAGACSVPLAAEMPIPIDIEHSPFAPILETNREPDLCEGFQKLIQKEFLGPSFGIDIDGKSWLHLDVHWIFSPNAPNSPGTNKEQVETAAATSYETDIDLNGTAELLVLFVWSHSWRGDNYQLVIYPSRAQFNSAKASSRNQNELFSRGRSVVGPSWLLLSVLEFNGHLYYYSRGTSGDVVELNRAELSLEEIYVDGRTEPTCRVALVPDDQSRVLETELASVAGYYRLLRQIAGVEGGCAGTLHAETRIALAAEASLPRAVYRPWALFDNDWRPYNPSRLVDSYVLQWGYQSLSQYRLYRHLSEAERTAVTDLAAHYESGFGLSQAEARLLAERVVDQIRRRHFVFPQDSAWSLSRWDLELTPTAERLADARRGDWPSERHPELPVTGLLRSTVLEGQSVDTIDWLLTVGADVNARTPTGEATLFAALEHPVVVKRLLAAGAIVNDRNGFGKSPLMYAAHYDLLPAAQILLESGADANAATDARADCLLSIGVGSRTALMYAAENASLEMVRLLLEYGADQKAEDTDGQGPLSYLQRNTRMSFRERRAAQFALRGSVQ